MTYANVQGLTEIKKEFTDKNIMKKHSGNMSNIRPLFYDNLKADANKVAEIKERFMYD